MVQIIIIQDVPKKVANRVLTPLLQPLLQTTYIWLEMTIDPVTIFLSNLSNTKWNQALPSYAHWKIWPNSFRFWI